MGKSTSLKRPVENLIAVLLIEVFLILFTTMLLDFHRNQATIRDIILTSISTINFILAIFIVKWLLSIDLLYLETCNIKQTLRMIRAERHDIINFLQSTYGLIDCNERNAFRNYLKELSATCRFNSHLLNIEDTVLRVLLQKKKYIADSLGISFLIETDTNLKQLGLNPSVSIFIFGNILDNAIEVLEDLGKSQEKVIKLKITETESSYIFNVISSSTKRDEEVNKNIFNEGFSTKGEQKSLELSTVEKMVTKQGGRVFYDNMEFTIILPVKKVVS